MPTHTPSRGALSGSRSCKTPPQLTASVGDISCTILLAGRVLRGPVYPAVVTEDSRLGNVQVHGRVFPVSDGTHVSSWNLNLRPATALFAVHIGCLHAAENGGPPAPSDVAVLSWQEITRKGVHAEGGTEAAWWKKRRPSAPQAPLQMRLLGVGGPRALARHLPPPLRRRPLDRIPPQNVSRCFHATLLADGADGAVLGVTPHRPGCTAAAPAVLADEGEAAPAAPRAAGPVVRTAVSCRVPTCNAACQARDESPHCKWVESGTVTLTARGTEVGSRPARRLAESSRRAPAASDATRSDSGAARSARADCLAAQFRRARAPFPRRLLQPRTALGYIAHLHRFDTLALSGHHLPSPPPPPLPPPPPPHVTWTGTLGASFSSRLCTTSVVSVLRSCSF